MEACLSAPFVSRPRGRLDYLRSTVKRIIRAAELRDELSLHHFGMAALRKVRTPIFPMRGCAQRAGTGLPGSDPHCPTNNGGS
jgi:hypothetical protein